jgi:DNA-directed RNA polymerase subunit RPC12/RpoP
MQIPIFGALICKFKGHKRGVPVREPEWHKGRKFFECPRCGHITSYKVKDSTVVPIKAAG